MTAPSKSFTVIPDADIDPDSPITTGLMTSYRDNDVHLEEWLGLSFTAAQDHDHDGVNSAVVDAASLQLKLIESIVISGSDVTTVDFATTLDGDADEQWIVTGKWRFVMAVGAIITLRFNSATATNMTLAAPVGGSNTFASAAWFRSELVVDDDTDPDLSVRHSLAQWTAFQVFGGGSSLGSGVLGTDFDFGGANITKLGFVANIASNIQIGSTFSLYVLKR